MGKQKKREKTGCICIILAAFVLCLSGILLLFNREQNKNKIRVVTVKGLDSDMENGQKVISFEDFRDNYKAEDTAVHYSVPEGRLSDDKYYVLKFNMRAKNTAAKVSVSFGDEDSHPYCLSTEWQTYYYPSIDGNVIDSLDWEIEPGLSDSQKTFLTNVSVYEYDKDSIHPSAIPNGTYPSSQDKEVVLETHETGTGMGPATDLIGDGEYIYSVSNGQMKISQKNADEEYHVIARIKHLGTVRHIEWVNDNVVAVAARENGVWFIDVSDRENPYIISCYDTLERANDVCFSGDLMFVAGRFYGVEIVNISDLENPEFIRKIAGGKECYRCTINQNYLFVSCWNTREIEIYDLSAEDEPKLAATIAVDGYCGEVFIEDHTLYVVTGYKAALHYEKIGAAGYGTGNGLEIYDISDISNPVWRSTVKTDGSMKGSGYDDWSVEVNGGYAYFTDCFNGTYIYNVRNPYAPKRVARLITPINKDSDDYVDFTSKDNVVFPYDHAESIASPAMGLYLNDGDIYIACTYSDIHKYSFDGAVHSQTEISQENYTIKEETKYQDKDIAYVLEDYDVYTIDTVDAWYIAGTDKGLILLDKDLNLYDTLLTEHAVKHISTTKDGYIITAEKTGVGIYEIREGKIRQCSFINSEAYQSHVFSVGITEDGNYAIAQSSWQKWEAIDLHDKNNPVFVAQAVSEDGKIIDVEDIESTGLMYYRSIVNGTINGAVGIAGNRNVLWFKSLGEQLQICSVYKNNLYVDTADSARLDGTEMAVQTTKGGYIIYDPLQGMPELDKLTNYKIEDVSLQGIITTKFNKMSVCNPLSGKVWIVGISDYENPVLLKYFKLRCAPNAALICADCILIPARHDGLVKVPIR